MSKTRLLGAVVSCQPERNATVPGGWNEMMTEFVTFLTLGVIMVAMSGSIAYAELPPTVLWHDNFTGQTPGTPISDLGWSNMPGFNTLTSYVIEATFEPPRSVRAWGMGVDDVYTLYQTVTGMDSKNNQTFHFKAHQANGVDTTMYDEVRVETSASVVLYWRIAERDALARIYAPGQTPENYSSTHVGDWASDGNWHDFDISYDGQTGPQTVTFKLDGATIFAPSIPFDLGYITQVQFVQQGGAKPPQGSGNSHLIGEMAVGTTDDDCIPPADPTGIGASPATVCSGDSSMLSVNDPGAGLTTDWTIGGCGGTAVPGGTGVNSVSVSPTSTTTYYARTRRIADGCMSDTCQMVTVNVPNCNDGNVCTTDTCSNGTCNHTNVPNGSSCEDGDPCTENDTCQDGTCVSGPPIDPCDTSNGFDTDVIYVLRGGSWESEVRMLDETKLDGPGPWFSRPANPADPVYHMDLGGFGTIADDTWPKAIKTVYKDMGLSQDDSDFKSLCFSNSPIAGTYTPAGVRLFGVIDVRSSEGPVGPDPPYYPGHEEHDPPAWDWTYSSASFQIIELNSAGKRIRAMSVGLAASQFYDLAARYPDFDAAKGGNGNAYNNHSPDMLCAPWGYNDEWGEYTRHNENFGCRVGNIRYNPVKNTLMVAANIGEWDNGVQYHPVTGEENYPRGRIYEFALPDWPEQYYTSEDQLPEYCTNKADMLGEPIPVSDPALVKLIQIYEMPFPHSVSSDNGQIRNHNARPAIDIDSDGNVYFTSRFFNATTPPCWQYYCTNPPPPQQPVCGWRWMGDCTGWDGDVVKCSTKGRIDGRVIYRVPIVDDPNTPYDEASNLVIDMDNRIALGQLEYWGGHGIAVRGDELVTVPHQEGCNDYGNGPPFLYPNIFDLTSTEVGYDYELLRLAYLGDYSDYTTCTGGHPDAGCPLFDATRANIPRVPYFAQLDPVSNRIFMANIMGACGDVQNFEVIQADNTVVRDVGYSLTVTNPDASSPGNLDTTWDAASPPGLPRPEPTGACCTGTPCNSCVEVPLSQCDPRNWLGAGTTCAEYGDVCPHACDDPSMDGDCDGDVDQDDFALFQRCYSDDGNNYPVGLNCQCFDKGGDSPDDNDIDSFDFDAFQSCASGPDVPADSECDDIQACCKAGPTCEDLTKGVCLDQSGTPQGAGTDCASVTCP
ncbi:MAG: hypothetical protein JSV03_00125 [Planctomycetota bacterium]|nr:MAG: hypothetical protein JSV03_00125 [Planctomycetota bacterium]